MKTKIQIYCIAITAWFMVGIGINTSIAQSTDSMQVITPFDSLTIDNIKANGNLKTSALEIRMTFHNDYAATAGVSLSLGGFADFGFTDEKGKEYKIYTDSHLIGTQDVNKGYLKIPFVQFGDKKFDWVTLIQQDISHGQKKVLIVRLNDFNKACKVIRDFHVRCILALDIEHVGEELYRIENIPVEWK